MIVHRTDDEAAKRYPKASLYLRIIPLDKAIFREDLGPDAKYIDTLVMENDQPMKRSRTISSDCDSLTPSKKSVLATKKKSVRFDG